MRPGEATTMGDVLEILGTACECRPRSRLGREPHGEGSNTATPAGSEHLFTAGGFVEQEINAPPTAWSLACGGTRLSVDRSVRTPTSSDALAGVAHEGCSGQNSRDLEAVRSGR